MKIVNKTKITVDKTLHGAHKDIEPYVDTVPDNNVILTATESLMLTGRPLNPKYARNKTCLLSTVPAVARPGFG
jgi:hypothetical protein